MQKFNSINLESCFIKKLLQDTYLPILPTINDGDLAVAGMDYAYKDNIIHCTLTGALNAPLSEASKCSIETICGPQLICGIGIRGAQYNIVDSFIPGKFKPGITSNFTSHLKYYSSDTHKYLGKYLRWYRDYYNIDLMPLYNCFTNESTNIAYLEDGQIKNGVNNKYINWIIPVDLNKTYSIYVNSQGPVSVKGIFLYNNGRIKTTHNKEMTYLDQFVGDNVTTHSSISYNTPIIYQSATTDPHILSFNNYFYIMLQTSANYTGSIAILEGNYGDKVDNLIVSGEIFKGKTLTITDKKGNLNTIKYPDLDYNSFKVPVKPSLTFIGTSTSIPYSDVLMEYLLQSAITNEEDIPNNIRRAQEALNITSQNILPDVWNDILHFTIYQKYFNKTNKYNIDNLKDTKDIEELVKYLPNNNIVLDNGKVIGTKNMDNKLIPSRPTQDILGYVDKEVENYIFKYRR